MFGNAEVWVVVVEWTGDDDVHIYVKPTLEEAESTARKDVVDTMNATVPDYDPDGCRQFVVANDEALDDVVWLAELRDLTTQPWVTIERHVVPINPASPINPDRPNLGQEEGPQDEHDD